MDSRILHARTRGPWWEFLDHSGLTIFVGREYEHLVLAISMWRGKPRVSYLPLPHPSGIAFDARRNLLHIASTRNPNQVFSLAPITSMLPLHRLTAQPLLAEYRPMVPKLSVVVPGSFYLHDLALIDGRLHGAAAGRNTVICLDPPSLPHDSWWPRSVAHDDGPLTDRNYLQLNSIAAAATLQASYFTASSARPATRRPGHRDYRINRRGVIFSGATREPSTHGLTRPHSARLTANSLLAANSGYGELVSARLPSSSFDVICRLPGWTRGLAVIGDTALLATSRILPGFEQYAPGIEPAHATCGIHAIDLTSGKILASLLWPLGDQIFAVEAVPRAVTHGFLHAVGRSRPSFDATRTLFGYSPLPSPHSDPLLRRF